MRRKRTALVVIALYNLLVVISFGVWQAIFNNFAVEELGVNASQVGLIQAIREIPGLVGIVVGSLALLMTEMHIAGLAVLVLGAGVALTGLSNDFFSLVMITLLMSTGFHFHYPANASAVLVVAGPDEAPKVLGRMNSLAAAGSVVTTLFILGTLHAIGYRMMYLIAGLVALVGGLVLLPFARQPVRLNRSEQRPPLLRRRYWLYYLLEFLMGSRRHMFTTFAVFLLVRTYQVTPQVITLLYLVNSLIGTYFNQALGRSIVRFGERKVLVLNFILLAVVFALYAVIPGWSLLARPALTVPNVGIGTWVLFPSFIATPGLLILLGLFVVDNLLFSFSIALQCYFQKIALGPEEITPNISLGQAINHLAAIVVPVVGGIMWDRIGSQYTFFAGVWIALIGLLLANWIRIPAAHPAPAAVEA